MKFPLFPFLLAGLLSAVFLSCSSSEGESTEVADTESDPSTSISRPGAPLTFTVNIDHFRMRDKPGLDGDVLATLNQGDQLTDLGEMSSFTTRIKLRGIWFNEPWLKVKTEAGESGWVYAGGLHFDLDTGEQLAEKLMQKRLENLFGEDLAASIANYRRAYQQVKAAADFAAVYRQGLQLRDSLNTVLEKKIEVPDLDKRPDLYWLEEAMPGYLVQLVAEGTIYYLFQDYKIWDKLARRSTGKDDDDFIAFQYSVHPIDSIEYFFPAWIIQTWDYGGHSELGKGVHNSLLKRANLLMANGTIFEPELLAVKKELLADILTKEQTYWQSQAAILQELDSILKERYGILTEEELQAIKARRNEFEHPAAAGIKLNLRAGGYDTGG
ncbi:MAG: SH3 domain-containing protein [Phaeodactylibacter sp.]|nr:SH3 domain-containing protein [Phaeodactylibacter sp.]